MPRAPFNTKESKVVSWQVWKRLQLTKMKKNVLKV
jgi:hypothetical protein